MFAIPDIPGTRCASWVILSVVLVLSGPALAGGLDVTGDAVAVDLPDGTILGEFLGPGVECAQFRLSTGEQISIEGQDFRTVAPGTLLRLTGDFARISRCMQGRAFVVQTIMPEPPAP